MGSRDDGRKNLQTSTGGRHDFFFYVNMADMHKFAFQRFQYGMRWWGDVYMYSNNNEEIYPIEFRNAYPDPNDAM